MYGRSLNSHNKKIQYTIEQIHRAGWGDKYFVSSCSFMQEIWDTQTCSPPEPRVELCVGSTGWELKDLHRSGLPFRSQNQQKLTFWRAISTLGTISSTAEASGKRYSVPQRFPGPKTTISSAQGNLPGNHFCSNLLTCLSFYDLSGKVTALIQREGVWAHRLAEKPR